MKLVNYLNKVDLFQGVEVPAEIQNLIEKVNLGRMSYDIALWRAALQESEIEKHRASLYTLYRDIEDDDQVSASVQQRKAGVLLADFSLRNQRGEIDEQATEYFGQLWFYKFLNNALDSIYYGFSLIDLSNFEPISYINLYPEVAALRKNAFDSNREENLVFYLEEEKYRYSVVEVFKSRTDIGLFNKVAPYYIWKKAFGSWAELGARFGMPFRVVKTDLRDEKRVANAKRMLKNLIGAGWAILNELDNYEEFQRTSVNSSSALYESLIQACDRAIARIIVGQTSTISEESYVGSANVHKSILDSFIIQDKIFIEAVINQQLIPRLVYFGEIPEGLTFEFSTSENISLENKVKFITQLAPYYEIPVEFVKQWTGIEVEPKFLSIAPESKANFVELVNFDEVSPVDFSETVLKGGVIKVTALDKKGDKITYGYRFPENFSQEQINNWLKQRGIKIKKNGTHN